MHILHIDDIQADSDVVSKNLKRIDPSLKIHWTPSCTKAIDLLKKQPFDCIVCDYQMPNINGMEFLCGLRKSGNDIPFIFLTGQSNEKLVAQAFSNGADDYFTKNESFAQFTRLANSIRHHVVAHRVFNDRLKASDRNQHSEKLDRALFENAGDAIFIIGLDGKYLEVNVKACEMLGRPREQIIGLSPQNFGSPENAKKFHDRMKKITEEGWAFFETASISPDGTMVHAEINARAIEYKGQKAILSIARDITERKNTERELYVKTRALETSVFGVAFADVEGKVTYANQALLRLWGYSEFEEIQNRSIFEFWDRTFSKKEMRKIFATLDWVGLWSNVAIAKRKDESTFFVRFTAELVRNDNNVPICIMATFADITEQMEAEKELLLKNYVVECSNTAIAIADTNGIITYANPALLQMGGYSDHPDEIIGQNTRRFFSSPKAVVPMYRGLKNTGSWKGELEARRKDGSLYPVLAAGSAVTDDHGEQICWMCSFQDLTERKDMENQLKLNSDILREKTQILESINKELKSFSYSVSHDLRAPLRYILGFSSMLKEHCSKYDDDVVDRIIEKITTSCAQMDDLINGLLKLSQVSSEVLTLSKVDLSKLARDIIEELRISSDDRAIECNIAEDLVVRGDMLLLRTAMTNLLSNAWKFTKLQNDPYIEVGRVKASENEDVIFIRDNGAGFDPVEIDKLFAPFKRLHKHDEFKGMGIGLATVQRIIHRHGGTIWAESTAGKGATFYFSLPRNLSISH